MNKKLQNAALKSFSFLIIIIGFLVFIQGTSHWYDWKTAKTIKAKGQQVYGTIEYLDSESNKSAIFNIDGQLERIDLKNNRNEYRIYDSLLFYVYKKNYILSTYKVSIKSIVFPIIVGLLIIFIGIYINRKIAYA
jgi:hypothetical protein